jgi:pilus assembly protein CpaE
MLVLNKADNRMGIRVENVESNIKHKVVLQIANAPLEMTLAINQGVPIVIAKREHRTAKDIFRLAQDLARMAGETVDESSIEPPPSSRPPQKPKQKQDGGFLKRLFSSR